MNLLQLSSGAFENLVFDLVCNLGLVNPKWRTPGSDEGRDIEGEYFVSDLSGYYQKQTWYIECKRYSGSVSWPLVWEKIAYAEAHCADVLLFANTSTISPQAQNQVAKWNASGKKPIIRIWNKVDIEEKLSARIDIAIKYKLAQSNVQKAADTLIPLTRLLINISNSLYSSKKESKSYQSKLDLAHSLAELLDTRISDLESYKSFYWRLFNADNDTYGWLSLDDEKWIANFDSFSLRAFLCYVKFSTKADRIKISRVNDSLKIQLNKLLESYHLTHLRLISSFSNFQFLVDGDDLIIERIENEG